MHSITTSINTRKNLLCQDLHLSMEIVFDKLLVTTHPNTWDDSSISLQLME